MKRKDEKKEEGKMKKDEKRVGEDEKVFGEDEQLFLLCVVGGYLVWRFEVLFDLTPEPKYATKDGDTFFKGYIF